MGAKLAEGDPLPAAMPLVSVIAEGLPASMLPAGSSASRSPSQFQALAHYVCSSVGNKVTKQG